MNAAKRTKLVALYVRVSTDHQTVKNQQLNWKPSPNVTAGPW